MARHLLAFALVFVIVGGPVVANVCDAICASPDLASTASHAHHHSSPPSAPSVSVVLNAVPYTCEHQAPDTFGLHQARQLLTAPAFVTVPMFSLSPSSNAPLGCRILDIEQSPPGILALTTQLRV
jgi:hypothetical protein